MKSACNSGRGGSWFPLGHECERDREWQSTMIRTRPFASVVARILLLQSWGYLLSNVYTLRHALDLHLISCKFFTRCALRELCNLSANVACQTRNIQSRQDSSCRFCKVHFAWLLRRCSPKVATPLHPGCLCASTRAGSSV